jgi:regulatory protein
MQKQQLSESEVLEKLRSFCAYRERCTSEVSTRARELGLPPDNIDNAIQLLEKEGFINDERFAELYVRSKFRQNQWGRFKIREGLYSKSVSKSFVELALAELDQDDYEKQAKELIEKFDNQGYAAERIFQKMKAKGYEGDLVYSVMQEMGMV